jgi:hypothetical protein
MDYRRKLRSKSRKLRNENSRLAKDSKIHSHPPKSQDATTQCPCFVLHEGWNPATCHKAASRKEPARETSQTESLVSEWTVECTLSALRCSALQGCSTCGIYYAGLSMPGFYAHMAKNEDHVRVKIKDNGAYVIAFNSLNDYFYGELEFFTTMESGEFMTRSCLV